MIFYPVGKTKLNAAVKVIRLGDFSLLTNDFLMIKPDLMTSLYLFLTTFT